MKKICLIAVLLLSTLYIPQLNAMLYWQKLCKKTTIYYAKYKKRCKDTTDWLHDIILNPDPKPIAFMEASAFDDFGEDAKEFDESYNKGTNLKTHCSKLQRRWLPIYRQKDKALLNYASSIILQEKEWNTWHKETSQCKERTRIKYIAWPDTETIKIEDISSKGEIKKTKYHDWPIVKKGKKDPEYIRQHRLSPYYKNISFSEDVRQDEKICSEFGQLNALENTAYHDELKFLVIQFCKMELYWKLSKIDKNGKKIKRTSQDKEAYFSQKKLLRKEIEDFKNDAVRTIFTRSKMGKGYSEKLLEMRKAYCDNACQ